MRIPIRVRPGASRVAVAGAHADRLVVAVTARAVDGAATDAALRAVAEAFGLRPRQVHLVSGPRSRDKVVELDLPDDDARRAAARRLTDLLGTSGVKPGQRPQIWLNGGVAGAAPGAHWVDAPLRLPRPGRHARA